MSSTIQGIDSTHSLSGINPMSMPMPTGTTPIEYEIKRYEEGFIITHTKGEQIEYRFIPFLESDPLKNLIKTTIYRILKYWEGRESNHKLYEYLEKGPDAQCILFLLFKGAKRFSDTKSKKESKSSEEKQELFDVLEGKQELIDGIDAIFAFLPIFLEKIPNISYDHSLTVEDIKTDSLFMRLKPLEAKLMVLRIKNAVDVTGIDVISPKVIAAFKNYDITHKLYEYNDWYALAVNCYLKGYLTKGELASLGHIASTTYENRTVEIIDIASCKGKLLMQNSLKRYFCINGSTAKETYQILMQLVRSLSPVERMAVYIDLEKPFHNSLSDLFINWLESNDFFIEAIFGKVSIFCCSPSIMQILLQLQFGSNAIEINITGGYSLKLDHWRKTKQRDAMVIIPGVYTPSVHTLIMNSPFEVYMHDVIYHMYIDSGIPLKHRQAFLELANIINTQRKHLQEKSKIESELKTQCDHLLRMRNFLLDRDFPLYARDETLRLYFGDNELTHSEKFWASIMLIRFKFHDSFEHKGLDFYFSESEYDENGFATTVARLKEHIEVNKAHFAEEYGIALENIESMKAKICVKDPIKREEVMRCADYL